MEEKAKISAQQKHIRNNYVRFGFDIKPDVLEQFRELCKLNGTTATTEIKKFINSYISENKK